METQATKENEIVGEQIEHHPFPLSSMYEIYIWHDDKRKVTCYQNSHGSLDCLPDAYITTQPPKVP